MEDKLNINVESKDGKITILHGDALPQHHPKCIEIEGTIWIPLEFVTKRKELLSKEVVGTSHIKVTRTGGSPSILLHVFDQMAYGSIRILGELTRTYKLERYTDKIYPVDRKSVV